MSERTWDSIVIGGGAAGLSAAQMLGRARRRTLVIDAGAPRNRFADHMHGVLGHDGRDPRELLRTGVTEAQRYGVVVRGGEVRRVREDGRTLLVDLASGLSERTRTIIIANDHHRDRHRRRPAPDPGSRGAVGISRAALPVLPWMGGRRPTPRRHRDVAAEPAPDRTRAAME